MTTLFPTRETETGSLQLASWGVSIVIHLSIVAASVFIVRGCDNSLPGGEGGERLRTVGLRVESAPGEGSPSADATDADTSSNDRPAADRTGVTDKEAEESFDQMLESVLQRTSPLDHSQMTAQPDAESPSTSPEVFDSLPVPDTFGPGMLLSPNSSLSGMPSGSAAPLTPGGGGLTGAAMEQQAPGSGRTTFMDVADAGESFAYVIDVSSSMRTGGKLRYAREQLRSSLSQLRPDQSFQVILYSDSARRIKLPTVDVRDLYAATTVNTRLAGNAVSAVTPNGGTEHAPAIREALRVGADVIFFMTDGDQPPMDPSDLRQVRKLNTEDARIHVIEFGDDSSSLGGTSWLQLLARQNDGAYRFKNVSD